MSQAARVMLLALFLATLGAACQTTRTYDPRRRTPTPARNVRLMKPTVAVMDFDNQSGFAGQWSLGGGMADMLITQLMKTERVVVLERRHLEDVVGEIARQGQELFRREGRVGVGRLKNARYMVRGVVTDFTVTGDTSGWFGTKDGGGWFGGSTAKVSLNLRVSDVETGEILASVRADGTAGSRFFGGAVNYKQVSFGGDAFFRTPLGRATESAMRRAVDEILHILPAEYWEPRIAEIVDGQAVVNGGENVGLRAGTEFIVRGEGKTITDPITGDAIERIAGPVLGLIRVVNVRATASYADILQGQNLQRGALLEPATQR